MMKYRLKLRGTNSQCTLSLIDGGTAFNDALHGMIILGKVMSANVIPATNGVDLGN